MEDIIQDSSHRIAKPKTKRSSDKEKSIGTFNKDEDMVEFRNKQNRTILRSMFLEESAWKIFSKKIRSLDPMKVWGFSESKKRDQTEFLHFIKSKQQKKENVSSKHRIMTVLEIYCDKLSKYYYPVFRVRRSDNREYIFSEADFPLLNIEDIEALYDHLSNLHIRPLDCQIAMKAIKRNMVAMMRLASVEDFQIGVEALQPKINLTIPNQSLEGLADLPFGSLIESPEYGIVCQNLKLKRIFIRFAEIEKYSDGTLKVVLKLLEQKLKQESIIHPENQDRDLIVKSINLVQEYLQHRNTIRRFEVCYGQRKKKFFKFPPLNI